MHDLGNTLLERVRGRRVPLWLKVAYTLFVCVLVPYYWTQYTPANFLYFCDVALLVTLAAMWLESPLLASMPTVAITLPQLLWAADFVVRFVAGVHIINLTEYMFDPKIPLLVRGLSLFHGWLPFLLAWLVWRLGYDRRAWWMQTALACVVLVVSCAVVADPFGPAGNLNKIFGPDDTAVQTWMPQAAWVGLLMLIHPVCIIVPTHFVLRRLMPQAPVPSPA